MVRATIYARSSDAAGYIDGNPDVFCKVSRGVWSLRYLNDTLTGRSREGLMKWVLSEMTEEEFMSFAGRSAEFRQELDRRVADMRQRYHM